MSDFKIKVCNNMEAPGSQVEITRVEEPEPNGDVDHCVGSNLNWVVFSLQGTSDSITLKFDAQDAQGNKSLKVAANSNYEYKAKKQEDKTWLLKITEKTPPIGNGDYTTTVEIGNPQ
jgi:hypothetical protein